MSNFDETKPEKMNPNSRQYHDQLNRIDSEAAKMVEKIIIEGSVAAAREKEQQNRRVLRQPQWRMH